MYTMFCRQVRGGFNVGLCVVWTRSNNKHAGIGRRNSVYYVRSRTVQQHLHLGLRAVLSRIVRSRRCLTLRSMRSGTVRR